MNLKGRNFLTLKDFTPEEITYMIDLAADLKAKKKVGELHEYYRGKNIALIFEKTSTRTRCSFEVAAHDLGMGSTYLDPTGSQIGKKESIADTARVLGRMYEGIEYRGFGQDIVEELAKHAGVPVWNGLTNEYHPTQMLADILTVREHFGRLKGLKLVYMGDARYNMGNSLMVVCSKLGLDFVACTNKKYFPNDELVAQCQQWAEEAGSTITLTEDVEAGTKDADIIYTDVWVSMGEPDEVWTERIHDLTPYKVTRHVMENAGEKAIFLHCLPAFHDLKTKIGKEMGERFNLTDMMADLFNEEIISQATHTKWAGKTVHFARETDSTNLWGKRAWREEGAGHGELFVAEYQSAGRGRFTRRWSAPPDSAITMSILICPKFSPQKAPMLTLVMGLSVAQAVAEIGLDVGIKWPNDVVVSRKKICGILTEMTMKQDKIGCAVIGVGINVNMKSFPEEMADKATSLYLESGHPFDRAQVVGLVMKHFEENYERFVQTEDLSGLKPDYEKMLANLNQPVRVLDQNDPYEGIARGINAGGELLVERADGTVEEVNSGEVSVRGLYSYV